LAEYTTSSDTTDKQCSNAFKQPVQIRYFLNYEYAKHACNLLSTKPYTFRGLRNSPEPCHSQFHETLHNVPKTAAVHHSMNNFFTAEKEDTDVSAALATEPNLDTIRQTREHYHSLQSPEKKYIVLLFSNDKRN